MYLRKVPELPPRNSILGRKWRSFMPAAERQFPYDPRGGAQPAWYALRVRSRSEMRVASLLDLKEIETFSPCWEERRRYTDRVHRTLVAAFPGYVFCRIPLTRQLRVLETPGVQYLVGSGLPEAIEDETICGLQKAFSGDAQVLEFPYLSNGETVRVMRGPMAGVSGILLKTKSPYRLILSVHLLQRSVAVEVDAVNVVACAPHAGTTYFD